MFSRDKSQIINVRRIALSFCATYLSKLRLFFPVIMSLHLANSFSEVQTDSYLQLKAFNCYNSAKTSENSLFLESLSV